MLPQYYKRYGNNARVSPGDFISCHLYSIPMYQIALETFSENFKASRIFRPKYMGIGIRNLSKISSLQLE